LSSLRPLLLSKPTSPSFITTSSSIMEDRRCRKDIKKLCHEEQDKLVYAIYRLQLADPGTAQHPRENSSYVIAAYHGQPFRGAGYGNSQWWGGVIVTMGLFSSQPGIGPTSAVSKMPSARCLTIQWPYPTGTSSTRRPRTGRLMTKRLAA
jgi:hypothetical protein